MTNVSKKPLPIQTQKKLIRQFVSVFARANESQTQRLLTQLLTESEQIMLMKRFAIVLMVQEGYSKYRIAHTLQVSEATVRSVIMQYQQGAYDAIIQMTTKPEFKLHDFISILETILGAGLPPMAGRGRWKNVSGAKPMHKKR